MRHHPIEVPFVHGSEVLRRRGRVSKEAHYLSSVTVSLREVTDDDAPVYLRVPERWMTTKEYRSHEGETYVAKARTSGDDPADLAWLRTEARVHRDRVNAFGGCRRVEGVASLGRLEADETVRQVVRNDEARWAEVIAENASRMLLVDGTLWEVAHEPVLRLNVFGKPRVKIALGIGLEPNDYRMDQADAIAEVGALGAEVGHRLDVEMPPFDLIRPDLLRAPALESSVNHVQGIILGAACRSEDRSLPEAFRPLRDDGAALLEATFRRAPHDLDASLRLMREACDMLETVGGTDYGMIRRKVDQVSRRFELQFNAPDEVASFVA